MTPLQFRNPRRALSSFAHRPMAPKAAGNAPLPKTGAVPRRCYYIKDLTKMPRAMSEQTCPTWGVGPAGRTKDQIVDLLFHADNRYYATGQLLQVPDQREVQWLPAQPEQMRSALGYPPQVPYVVRPGYADPPLAAAGAATAPDPRERMPARPRGGPDGLVPLDLNQRPGLGQGGLLGPAPDPRGLLRAKARQTAPPSYRRGSSPPRRGATAQMPMHPPMPAPVTPSQAHLHPVP